MNNPAENPTLDAIFSNPLLLSEAGTTATGQEPSAGAGADNASISLGIGPSTYGENVASSDPQQSQDSLTDDKHQVYSPKMPDLLSTYNTGLGTINKMMQTLYQPDQSMVKNPAQSQATVPSVYGNTSTPVSNTETEDPNADAARDQGMTDTEKYLEHGRKFYYDNTVGADNVVGNSGTIAKPTDSTTTTTTTAADTSGGGWRSGVGTEFGEVDNPAYGGYTEAGWNKGAWGDNISGWDTEGVALPNVPHGTRVEVMNPENGKTTITTVKDRGPGKGTGADIDMLGGTRAALGLSKNFKGQVKFRVLSGSAQTSDTQNHKSFGADLADENTEGASLPETVVKNSIGDYDNDSNILEALRRGDYKLAVSNQDGDTRLMPLIAAGPSDWTGNALHLTSLSANDLNAGGGSKVSYKLIAPDGNAMPIKGYHPHSYALGDLNDHIGPNRKTPGDQTNEHEAFKGLSANDKALYASGKNNKELFKQPLSKAEQEVHDRVAARMKKPSEAWMSNLLT